MSLFWGVAVQAFIVSCRVGTAKPKDLEAWKLSQLFVGWCVKEKPFDSKICHVWPPFVVRSAASRPCLLHQETCRRGRPTGFIFLHDFMSCIRLGGARHPKRECLRKSGIGMESQVGRQGHPKQNEATRKWTTNCGKTQFE